MNILLFLPRLILGVPACGLLKLSDAIIGDPQPRFRSLFKKMMGGAR
jgi:hypothetical protein